MIDEPENATDAEILSDMNSLIEKMKAGKPDDRSKKDRRYAISITEMEKTMAFFYTYCYIGWITEGE